MFILNGGIVSWKRFKQQTVADLTTEIEYIAASEAIKEVVWVKKFIMELGVVSKIEGPVPLYYDNTRAIIQAKELRSYHRSKHILRCFHLIQEIVERQDIILEWVDTNNNIADHSLRSYHKSYLIAILIVWDWNTKAIGFSVSERLKEEYPISQSQVCCDGIFFITFQLI